MSSSGAIKRARLENEPMISYEDFVEDLDRGDSFTTSLIEILVKVRHPSNAPRVPLLLNSSPLHTGARRATTPPKRRRPWAYSRSHCAISAETFEPPIILPRTRATARNGWAPALGLNSLLFATARRTGDGRGRGRVGPIRYLRTHGGGCSTKFELV